MAIALVVNTVKQGTSTGVTSDAVDTSGASLLVLGVNYYGPSGLAPTISDSKANTWTPLTSIPDTDENRTRLYYAENPTVGASHTFTASGVESYASVALGAFSGCATTSPFDQQNGAPANTFVYSIQPGSITPTEDNELIVSCLNSVGATSNVAINSSMSITNTVYLSAGVSFGISLAYLVQTSAGAINPTWSWSGVDGRAMAAIASFKAAASGGILLRHPGMSGMMDKPGMAGGLNG